MYFFVLIYNTNGMKKTFIQWFFVKTKNKNNTLTVHIFYNLQNHPTFLSDERLVNWARGRECFVGLSVLIVYGLHLIYSGVLSILVVVIDGILLRFATRPGGEFFLVCQPENAFIMWYKNKVMFWNICFFYSHESDTPPCTSLVVTIFL